MKCELFLPYYSYNDDKFDMGDYYTDSQSYIDALNQYATQDSNFMKIEKKIDDVNYAHCSATLYNSDNNDLSIDELVGYYGTNGLIMLIVELDLATEDDEFDMELNGWINEHEKLDKINGLDEDKRFLVEPKRDVKVIFTNLANKESYCTLVNSMMLQKVDNTHFVLIVDKIVFTKKF